MARNGCKMAKNKSCQFFFRTDFSYKKPQNFAKFHMPYDYSRPHVYFVCQIFQAPRLFPAIHLFRTLESSLRGDIWSFILISQ